MSCKEMKKRLALFDFDGTLTTRDSLIPFACMAIGRWKVLVALMRALPWILMWKMGLIPNSRAKEKLFGFMYKGIKFSDLQNVGDKFSAVIDGMLRKNMVERLQKCIAGGYEVAIVSAGLTVRIEPWARRQGNIRVLATEPEIDSSGKITGKFLAPNCYGQEKVNRIREAFPDLNDYQVVAYGDSAGDKEMLSLANISDDYQ